jgi:hypothetical protein
MPPRNEIDGGTQVGIRACGAFPLPQATGVNIPNSGQPKQRGTPRRNYRHFSRPIRLLDRNQRSTGARVTNPTDIEMPQWPNSGCATLTGRASPSDHHAVLTLAADSTVERVFPLTFTVFYGPQSVCGL